MTYDDEAPWPTSADGGGSSLARLSDRSLGHSSDGWIASAPSPGEFAPQTGVLGSYVFYRDSTFDNPAKGRTEDDAIATDKTPLLPGETATFANYTSYSRGINGIMIDVIGLADGVAPDASDFAFRVGNNDEPDTWDNAPAPEPISVRTSAGAGGADRITITWPDGAIQNEWLEITVLAAGLGLPEDAVFYWGNAVGESGDSASHALVNVTDALGLRENTHGPLDPAAIIPPLADGLRATRAARAAVKALSASADAQAEADFLLLFKERDFVDALTRAAGAVPPDAGAARPDCTL